jgi:hypothetical protein
VKIVIFLLRLNGAKEKLANYFISMVQKNDDDEIVTISYL